MKKPILTLRETTVDIGDRTFILREFNGQRADRVEEIAEEALELASQLQALEPHQREEKRKLRAAIRRNNYDLYRVFLIPRPGEEPPSDEWLAEHWGAGTMEYHVQPLQVLLNNHQDVLPRGNGPEATAAAEGALPGPIFAAH